MKISDEFMEEIKGYSIEDLYLIYETQKDLYTEEEMELIKKQIQLYEKEEEKKFYASLPKDITCHKCDGINSIENEVCIFCGASLNKRKQNFFDSFKNHESDNTEQKNETDSTFPYFKNVRNCIFASIVLAVLGLAFMDSWDTEVFGFVLEYLSALLFAIAIDYLIAKEFELVAIEKGYNDKKYFWYSFFLGVIGYLLVIALPNKSKEMRD